jgi:hypothetical protein
VVMVGFLPSQWAPKRYSFQEGQIVDFRSLRMSNLEEQKNRSFLEGRQEWSVRETCREPRDLRTIRWLIFRKWRRQWDSITFVFRKSFAI